MFDDGPDHGGIIGYCASVCADAVTMRREADGRGCSGLGCCSISSREPFVGFGLESLRKKILQGLLRALMQLASRRSWRTCTVHIISAWGISCMRRQIITALLAPLPPSTFQLWSQISQTVRGLGWIQSCMLVACMTAEMMKLEGTSVLAPTNLMFVVTPISLVGALKVSIIILHLAPVVVHPEFEWTSIVLREILWSLRKIP